MSGTRRSQERRDLTRAIVALTESGCGGKIMLAGGDVVVIEPAGAARAGRESDRVSEQG
jgi:hypothetical protein